MPAVEIARVEETNIWLAAADGKVDVVEHLLKHGGPSGAPLSPNIKDDSGYTPLHAAAAYSHIPLIDLLVLGYNADINIVDDDGDTPLHVCETLEAAKRLKELGADVDMKNEEDKRPIESADDEERDEVVEYLKEFCPDYTPASREDVDLARFAHLFQDAVAAGGIELPPREDDGDEDEDDESTRDDSATAGVTLTLDELVIGIQNGTISPNGFVNRTEPDNTNKEN